MVELISTAEAFEDTTHLWYCALIIECVSVFDHFWNSISIFNNTPLIYASQNGYAEIVQLLLSQPGIEVNCKGIEIPKFINDICMKFFKRISFEVIYGINSKFFMLLH